MVFLIFSNNWLILFFRLELNIVILIVVLKKRFYEFKVNFFLKYWLIQSFNSLVFIFLLILNRFRKRFRFFIIILLFIKIGLPPLYIWIEDLILSLSLKSLILVLFLQKIPIFVLIIKLKSLRVHLILILRVFILVIRSLKIVNELNFNKLLFFRRVYNSRILIVFIWVDHLIFFIYLIFYFSIRIIFIINFSLKFSNFGSNNKGINFNFIQFIFFLLGLPP